MKTENKILNLEDVDVSVYMISHPGSDKIYIGITRRSLDKRLKAHKSLSLRNRRNKKILSFKESWLCKAIDNGHEIRIEEIDVVKGHEFSFWEKYYISLFKMFGFTLTNMTEGGDGFVSNGLTDEQRAKLSEARKKIVVEYDINGNVVNEFESLTFASEATGLERKRLNHSVLNKKKLCDGRMFRYKSQKISLEDVRLAFETRNKEKRKPVLQFDLSGNLISEYKSASHTPFNATNSQKSAIAKACRGDYKTRYGFIWKYKN